MDIFIVIFAIIFAIAWLYIFIKTMRWWTHKLNSIYNNPLFDQETKEFLQKFFSDKK